MLHAENEKAQKEKEFSRQKVKIQFPLLFLSTFFFFGEGKNKLVNWKEMWKIIVV